MTSNVGDSPVALRPEGAEMGLKALIIVDVQPTFCEGGELGVDGGNAVARRIASYVDERRCEYSYIATTQDWHVEPGAHFSVTPDFIDSWPAHGVAGTPNARLHPAIAALGVAHHFKKGQYGAAYSGFEGIEDGTDRVQTRSQMDVMLAQGRTLANALRDAGIDAVDVVGIAESHCVKQTALDARNLGFDTTVYRDLTVPVSEEQGEDARRAMAAAGVTLTTSRLRR